MGFSLNCFTQLLTGGLQLAIPKLNGRFPQASGNLQWLQIASSEVRLQCAPKRGLIHDRKLEKPETANRAGETLFHVRGLGHGRHVCGAAKCLRPATLHNSSPPPHSARVSLPRLTRSALEPAVPSFARFPAPAKR